MIDWASFAVVGIVSLVGACTLVAFAALGIRLSNHEGPRWRVGRAGAIAAFGVCGAAVAFGVYLIVPAFN